MMSVKSNIVQYFVETTTNKEKSFDTVKTFREIKEQISEELLGKDFEQIKAYLKANSLKQQEEV